MQTPTVIELRRYLLHPGRRDDLIELFEREFIETQEGLGLQVLGIFREHAAPDHFVWLRGFAGMAERLLGLHGFYGGPLWQKHRNEANATMIDSDNVLLLRPITRWPAKHEVSVEGHWHALICPLQGPLDEPTRAALREQPGLWLDSEPSENNFPRLPVRSGSWVLGLDITPPDVAPALQARLAGTTERLTLAPTTRSRMR